MLSCRISSISWAGISRAAHRSPKARRRSWADAVFFTSTRTFALAPMPPTIFETRSAAGRRCGKWIAAAGRPMRELPAARKSNAKRLIAC